MWDHCGYGYRMIYNYDMMIHSAFSLLLRMLDAKPSVSEGGLIAGLGLGGGLILSIVLLSRSPLALSPVSPPL